MKTIASKAGILLLVYYCTLILEACCNCPSPDLPFFDYKTINVETFGPSDEHFSFSITFDSIRYLASHGIIHGLSNSAYACSCENDGDWGAKFQVTAINIYADSVFDAAIAPGDPLNILFEVDTHYNTVTGRYNTIPLDEFSEFPLRLHTFTKLHVSSTATPVTYNRPYYFDIEVVKGDGSVVRTTVGPLTWSD